MNDIRTVKIVVTRDHWPNILVPHAGPMNAEPRYAIRLPSDAFPEATYHRDKHDNLGPTVGASSRHPPVVIAGEGTAVEQLHWEELIQKARNWRYPIDRLFIGREIEVAARTYTMSHNRFRPYREETFIDLRGVKVGGKLDEDEGLAAHILEVKGRFNGA